MPRNTEFQVVALREVPLHDFVSAVQPDPPLVLVVDDEQIIADTRTAILRSWGYCCLTAYDAASALSLASTIHPELLICDILLSGMSGIELAIQVQRMIPNCRVLIISGFPGGYDMFCAARDAGHEFTYLAKPVHLSELNALIQTMLVPVEIDLNCQQIFFEEPLFGT